MNLDRFMDNNSSNSNIARGIIAGFLGGLAGALVKKAAEQFLEVREIDEQEAQLSVLDDLSQKVAGTSLRAENLDIADQFKDIPLGASVGAAYGYGKKDDEDINLFDGAFLGATTWASTHETSLPVTGLDNGPEDLSLGIQLQELFAHLLYGVTTEVVRGFVSQRIKELNRKS